MRCRHGPEREASSHWGLHVVRSIMEPASVEAINGVLVGDVIADKYRIERVVGMGGMGTVVAAHHIQLDEKVAIKFLRSEMLGNAETLRRFAREARASARIKSEHVVRVFDVGSLEPGIPYIVMEYLEGGDLATWLWQHGPLTVEVAVDFVLQACEAVAEAHSLGIIHRDLKPANLFCSRRPDGELAIKVLDFGISKAVDAETTADGGSVTKSQAAIGSPVYMAPEQMRSARDVDAGADIWSLGVILYELLAGHGKVPFPGNTLVEIAIRASTCLPLPLRDARADVPAGLERVIGRCLEKQRANRYRDVGEFAAALVEFGSTRAAASSLRIGRIMESDRFSAKNGPLGAFGRLLVDEPVPSRSRISALVESGSNTRRRRGMTPAVQWKNAALVGASGAVLALAILAVHRLSSTRSKEDVADAASATGATAELSAPAGTADAAMLTSGWVTGAAAPSIGAVPPSAAGERLRDNFSELEAERRGHLQTMETAQANPSASTANPKRAPPPRRSPTPPLASTPSPAASATDCSVPYFFDVNGTRIFKKECL